MLKTSIDTYFLWYTTTVMAKAGAEILEKGGAGVGNKI